MTQPPSSILHPELVSILSRKAKPKPCRTGCLPRCYNKWTTITHSQIAGAIICPRWAPQGWRPLHYLILHHRLGRSMCLSLFWALFCLVEEELSSIWNKISKESHVSLDDKIQSRVHGSWVDVVWAYGSKLTPLVVSAVKENFDEDGCRQSKVFNLHIRGLAPGDNPTTTVLHFIHDTLSLLGTPIDRVGTAHDSSFCLIYWKDWYKYTKTNFDLL